MRDPRVESLLATCQPVVVEDHQWARPLRISSYLGAWDLPADLVTSIRVLVQVGDSIVIGSNVDGTSTVLPGGRVEPGESWIETGCREVREETGWIVDPDSFEPLGFMHLFNLGEPDPRFPHPDVLWPVFLAQGIELEADGWIDVEGYVISSKLETVAHLDRERIGDLAWCYVDELRRRPRSPA